MPSPSDLFDAVLALPLPATLVTACDTLRERAQTAAETLLAQAEALLAAVEAFALVSLAAFAGC